MIVADASAVVLAFVVALGDSPAVGGATSTSRHRRVVAVAIFIADAEELGAVAIRRLAETVGLGTMSIYPTCPARPNFSS